MIGVFMGSFDPVHNGHVNIVRMMLNQKKDNMINIENVNDENALFSKIIVLPAVKNPFKTHSASFAERVMMLNIALKNEIEQGVVEISTHELEIASDGQNKDLYNVVGVRSYESMNSLVDTYGKDNVVFIMTSETMLEMETWWNNKYLPKFKYFLIKFDNIYNNERFKIKCLDVYNIIGEITIETPKVHSSNIRKGSRSLREKCLNPDVLKFIDLYNLYKTNKNWSYVIPDGEHKGKELWSGRNLAACGIIILKDGKRLWLLANKRGPGCPDYKGYWNMPCGYVEGNESAVECVLREINEECNLRLKGTINEQIDKFKLIYIEDEPGFCNGSNVTMRYFAVITKDDIEHDISLYGRTGGEKDEVSQISWIPIESYEDYSWAFNHKSIIDNIIKQLNNPKNPDDIFNDILFEKQKK